MGLGLRVLLAVNDSTAQPGSPPECSASVSKNHNTVYTTTKSGEGGANRVRVALAVSFTCTSSHCCLLFCSTTGSETRACAPVCYQLKPRHVREGDDQRIHSVGPAGHGSIDSRGQTFRLRP